MGVERLKSIHYDSTVAVYKDGREGKDGAGAVWALEFHGFVWSGDFAVKLDPAVGDYVYGCAAVGKSGRPSEGI